MGKLLDEIERLLRAEPLEKEIKQLDQLTISELTPERLFQAKRAIEIEARNNLRSQIKSKRGS